MGLFGFGKKKRAAEAATADEAAEEGTKLAPGADAHASDDEKTHRSEAANFLEDPKRGPWDASDAPAEGRFLDLGGFRLPARDGISLRLSVSPDKKRVLGVTVTFKESSLELSAIAAPKSHGLWEEIRAELLAGGKDARESKGTFGKEIALTVTIAPGRTVPTRIVGVDGARWMLRGIFTGKAAQDGDQKDALDDFFSGIVVDRGEDPLAPRDPLPLHAPTALDADADDADESQDSPEIPGQPKGPLTPMQNTEVQQTLSRGPMFSEIR